MNAVVPVESAPEDFSKLLIPDANHDAEIKCGELSVKAHKIILSARSEVFKEMLKGQTDSIKIKDMDINYLKDFVRYLYSGLMPDLTFEKAKNFYEAGDRYDIRSLMQRCSEYFEDTLSHENAFHCFALADAHSDQKLASRVKTYILEEKMYLEDDLWEPFYETYPKFALEVRRSSCKRKINQIENV